MHTIAFIYRAPEVSRLCLGITLVCAQGPTKCKFVPGVTSGIGTVRVPSKGYCWVWRSL